MFGNLPTNIISKRGSGESSQFDLLNQTYYETEVEGEGSYLTQYLSHSHQKISNIFAKDDDDEVIEDESKGE
jgi:hypothetical protein